MPPKFSLTLKSKPFDPFFDVSKVSQHALTKHFPPGEPDAAVFNNWIDEKRGLEIAKAVVRTLPTPSVHFGSLALVYAAKFEEVLAVDTLTGRMCSWVVLI